jgi:hypothetical protein
MPVRWVATPEPIPNQIVTLTGQVQFLVRDFGRAATESRVDVYPGEETLLDIAVRFEDEENCYGWNNDSYFFNWRNPNWRLTQDRYLVKVVITSSGQRCVGKFRMINNVNSYSDFRVTELLPEDRTKKF